MNGPAILNLEFINYTFVYIAQMFVIASTLAPVGANIEKELLWDIKRVVPELRAT